VEVEESLQVALDSLTKAEDKIWAYELESEQAKRDAYETGSKEAQDEMGFQLPGVCNEFYTDDAAPRASFSSFSLCSSSPSS
jgi:hypothetical protein